MTQIFEGVRVVELAQYVFVPASSTLLADHGAEVIKIEPPITGDPYRTLKVGDGRETATANMAMEQNNRGKKSVAIDLKNPEGREALLRLVDTADVFITSLRPLALKALRLEPEDLMSRNPRLIYARGNGLGFKGAEFNKAGYDASAFWAREDSPICSPHPTPMCQPVRARRSAITAVRFRSSLASLQRCSAASATGREWSLKPHCCRTRRGSFRRTWSIRAITPATIPMPGSRADTVLHLCAPIRPAMAASSS